MEIQDPVPTVSIPVAVGRRTVMVPLGSPEDCDALIARVCAAKAMIFAAAAALTAWTADEPVDCEIVDDDEPEEEAWRLTPAGLAALADEPGGRELCSYHGGSDDNLGAGCEQCAEEEAILDAADAEPEPSLPSPRPADPCKCGHIALKHHLNQVVGELQYCNECPGSDDCAVFSPAEPSPEAGTGGACESCKYPLDAPDHDEMCAQRTRFLDGAGPKAGTVLLGELRDRMAAGQ